MSVKVQSYTRLVWPGRSASKGPHSPPWLVRADGWQEAYISCYVDIIELLSVLITWQLASPGVSDVRESVREPRGSCNAFSDLVLKVTRFLLPHPLH